MKFLGYLRVSSKTSQSDNTSLETQRIAIEKYAKERNWEVEFFVDMESGGSIEERKSFLAMMEKSKDDDIDGIIVYANSRLSRSLIDARLVIRDLLERKKLYVSVSDNVDLSTPFGIAMYSFHLTMIELEKSTIANRMKDGRVIRIKDGKKASSALYGYKFEGRGSNKKLVEVKEEVEVLKLMAKLYIKHKNYSLVAREINKLGFKTRRGLEFSVATTRNLLTNKSYIGILKYDGEEYRSSDINPVFSNYTWNKLKVA